METTKPFNVVVTYSNTTIWHPYKNQNMHRKLSFS